jgi:hypothetical protein
MYSCQGYQNAYHICIKDPKMDFLVPICFACDEVKLNGGGQQDGGHLCLFLTAILNPDFTQHQLHGIC